MTETNLSTADTDRLTLLDRLAERMPDLDLDRRKTEWLSLEDGHEALLVDGGGLDGGQGMYFANAGEDVHGVGSLMPLAPVVGCIVFKPDGTRLLARVERDPLAVQPDP
jgi:hypothetical protein